MFLATIDKQEINNFVTETKINQINIPDFIRVYTIYWKND
jgi:hypothetical protein